MKTKTAWLDLCELNSENISLKFRPHLKFHSISAQRKLNLNGSKVKFANPNLDRKIRRWFPRGKSYMRMVGL